ncbi:MAG: hypothetical protein ACOX6Y_00230 [Christensenellales bacterium]
MRGAAFDEVYGELARDELNVKEVVFTDDASAFTGYKLKPPAAHPGPALWEKLGPGQQNCWRKLTAGLPWPPLSGVKAWC